MDITLHNWVRLMTLKNTVRLFEPALYLNKSIV